MMFIKPPLCLQSALQVSMQKSTGIMLNSKQATVLEEKSLSRGKRRKVQEDIHEFDQKELSKEIQSQQRHILRISDEVLIKSLKHLDSKSLVLFSQSWSGNMELSKKAAKEKLTELKKELQSLNKLIEESENNESQSAGQNNLEKLPRELETLYNSIKESNIQALVLELELVNLKIL